MPYRRTYKRRPYRRYRKRNNVAYKANKKASKALSILKGECKYCSVAISGDYPPIAAAEIISPTASLIQGLDDINDRIGREITLKSIYLNLALDIDASNNGWCRTMIVIDKQPESVALPIISNFQMVDLLEDISTNTLAIASPTNYHNRQRFEVLMDKRVYFSNGSRVSQFIRFYKHMKYRKMSFNSTTANSENKFRIMLIMFSNVTVGQPDVSGNFRVTFYDH